MNIQKILKKQRNNGYNDYKAGKRITINYHPYQPLTYYHERERAYYEMGYRLARDEERNKTNNLTK